MISNHDILLYEISSNILKVISEAHSDKITEIYQAFNIRNHEQLFLSVSLDKQMGLYQLTDNELQMINKINVINSAVSSIRQVMNTQLLILGDYLGDVYLFDLATLKVLSHSREQHSSKIISIQQCFFNQEIQYLIACQNTISLWKGEDYLDCTKII